MARISKDPQIRMAEILDTAENLFYARGYHETAISDIVKEIGVAQGTFYYYFKSKEGILEALINRQISKFASELEATVASTSIGPSRKLEMLMQIMFHTLRYKEGLMFEFLYDDRHLHLMDKLARQGKQVVVPYLLKIIEEGKSAKVFNFADPRIAVTFVMGIMECLFVSMYEKVPAHAVTEYVAMALGLIEKTLGMPADSLQITV